MLEGLLAGKALVDCDPAVPPKLAPPNKELEFEEAIGNFSNTGFKLSQVTQ